MPPSATSSPPRRRDPRPSSGSSRAAPRSGPSRAPRSTASRNRRGRAVSRAPANAARRCAATGEGAWRGKRSRTQSTRRRGGSPLQESNPVLRAREPDPCLQGSKRRVADLRLQLCRSHSRSAFRPQEPVLRTFVAHGTPSITPRGHSVPVRPSRLDRRVAGVTAVGPAPTTRVVSGSIGKGRLWCRPWLRPETGRRCGRVRPEKFSACERAGEDRSVTPLVLS